MAEAEPAPVIIPLLQGYAGDDTNLLAQYLLEEIYRDYHSKHFVFIVAPERSLVPEVRWRNEMRARINHLFREITCPERDKLPFMAILTVSPAFMEALMHGTDDLWALVAGLLAANQSSIEFYARSRGVSWLRAVREFIPKAAKNPEVLLRAFNDSIVEDYPPPNSISDEVLHRNLNDHGPDTFYLSMAGAIVPIEAPSYNDAQLTGLQIIDITECTYDPSIFSQYSRTPDWPWLTWPRHPQTCDVPDIDDDELEEPARCVRCEKLFSGEEDWHNDDIGCQCHDLFMLRDALIQIVEYPPFPDEPNIVNRGVRALQAFDVDTMIGEYTGVLMPNVYDPDSEICDKTYLFGLYDQTRGNYIADISARMYGNWTRFINHTDDEAKQNVRFRHEYILNRLRVVVVTIQKIEFGDEILGHYGRNYFPSRKPRSK